VLKWAKGKVGKEGRFHGRKRGKVKSGIKPGGQALAKRRIKGWKCVLCRLARHNTTNKICQYFCHYENYTYLTSINMSETTKVTFQLHLYPFDVAFSKIQTECNCVT
jgi:hypothetical protein